MQPAFWVVALAWWLAGPAGPAPAGRTVRVYQYEGRHRAARRLVLTRVYNARHALVLERCYPEFYEDFEAGYGQGLGRGSRRNTYQDTVLVKSVATGQTPGDSTRLLYGHDQRGRRTGWQRWEYTRPLRKGVDKGLGRPGGCIVLDDDYERYRVWRHVQDMSYAYDDRGRLVAYALRRPGGAVTEQQRWVFDQRGRLSKRLSFCGSGAADPCFQTVFSYDSLGKLRGEVQYSYGRVSGRSSYRTAGRRVYEDGVYDAGTGSLSARNHHVRTLDAAGRLVQETYYQGRCELESTVTISYRPDGRIARAARLTCRDQRRIVHEYEYQ